MRRIAKLTALDVSRAKGRGYRSDGGGLYLHVGGGASKAWVFRYRVGGRAREMGLGPVHTVSLAEARDAALAARKLVREGVDPIDHRRASREATRAAQASRVPTFQACAEAYIASHKAGWANAKHASQWTNTLATYAFPVLGAVPVSAIDTGLVMQVIEPLWREKTETASRVRGRIESVLDWAKVKGYRDGENPARWRGCMEHLLPERGKIARVSHHAALPWREAPAFMGALRQREGMAARALEFAILASARSGEVRDATWAEIDLDNALWTVQASRMKAKREHRVPLSPAAVALLRSLPRDGELVFPGSVAGRPLSDMSLTAVLRRMGRGDLTAHGFRSTFRDFCGETGKPDDIAEAALAHILGGKTQVAYQRGDLLDRRRVLMAEWAAYLAATDAVSSERIAAE